ncbi:AraC family transcriptional regulator [Paenibacillus thermoaerophilus]|nr:AraC family transcriptional regulator [Paenibacillus thermoaerophilus]
MSGVTYYLFRLQTEGRCKAYTGGRMTTIEAGDLLLYRPGDPYELIVGEHENGHAAGKISSGDYFVMCRGPWVDEWWKRSSRPSLVRTRSSERLVELWRQLLLEHRRIGRQNPELLEYLLRCLLLLIDRAITETSSPGRHAYIGERMKRYIEENAYRPFKVEELARHVGLSVSRASHLFKDCFGTSIMQYAMDVRLSTAAERIRYSFLSLERVAETSGFASYTYFHRAFRARYGMSPREYRQKWRES